MAEPAALPERQPPPGLSPELAPRVGNALLGVVLVLGAALRLVVWGQARSFYLDEANLLRNFAERGYADLFRPLGYEQFAPPLLSVLLKLATDAFGYGERAARLVPLLAGLATLGVMGALARRWLTPLAAVLATAFVAFGSIYVEYATTTKQYSTDALVALALLALADRQLRRPELSGKAALAWAAGGAAVVWGSMPAVFGLAGVGLAFGWRYGWRAPAGRAPWGRLVGLALAWAGSFGLYFLLLLRTDVLTPHLQHHHDAYFLAFPPRSGAEWTLLGEQLRGLVDRGFGKTGLALALAAVGVGGGTIHLIRRAPARALLLLVPLAATLAASALHYYSLIARLMLFALPLLGLVIFTGLEAGARRLGAGPYATGLRVGLLGLVLATLANQQRLPSLFGKPFQTDFADVRAGLRYVTAHQRPGELLFVLPDVTPVAYHYRHLAPLRPRLGPLWWQAWRPLPGDDSALIAADVAALVARGRRRLWFISNLPDPALRRWAAATGIVSHDTTFFRGYAFCWEARPE